MSTLSAGSEKPSLDALIERLTAATNPYLSDLNNDIFEAVAFPAEYFGSKIESWSRGDGRYTINTVDGIRHLDALRAPSYTLSIDAALSLIPSANWWEIGKTSDEKSPMRHFGPAGIYVARTHSNYGHSGEHGAHDLPAVALCIAALRYRQSVAQEQVRPPGDRTAVPDTLPSPETILARSS